MFDMQNKKYYLVLLISLITFFCSCNKDSSIIGFNLQPGSDFIELDEKVIDVSTYTVTDFNISSNQRTISPLGEYKDPVFGLTKAMFTCQLLLSSGNVNFSAIRDNVNEMILQLKYRGNYGNSDEKLNIKVYRILDDIYRDSVYYSNFRINEQHLTLLSETELEILEDSLIKIEMPQQLINDFLNPSDSIYFKDNESFISFFKGIYVTAEYTGSEGQIVYIDLLSNSSRMDLIYNDTSRFSFTITTASTIINQFEHDYSDANQDLLLNISDTTINNSLCFLQSLGGLRTRIHFPELENSFETDKIIGINKAQLIIYIKQEADVNKFTPPTSLNLIAIDDNGRNEFLTDYKVNSAKFGGILNSEYHKYTFNIPLYIQEIISGSRNDNGLYLFPSNNRIYANRAVIYGGAYEGELAMKLEVLYSKY